MAFEHGLIDDVFCNLGFAYPVSAEQDNIVCIANKLQLHQFSDQAAVYLLGPVPFEVGQRLERPEAGITHTSFKTPTVTFSLLPFDQLGDPVIKFRIKGIGVSDRWHVDEVPVRWRFQSSVEFPSLLLLRTLEVNALAVGHSL